MQESHLDPDARLYNSRIIDAYINRYFDSNETVRRKEENKLQWVS